MKQFLFISLILNLSYFGVSQTTKSYIECINEANIDTNLFYSENDYSQFYQRVNGAWGNEHKEGVLSLNCVNKPLNIKVNEPYSIIGKAFKGEGPYHYKVDFDDTTIEKTCNSRYFKAHHVYVKPGIYDVSANISNEKGEKSSKGCSKVYVDMDSVKAILTLVDIKKVNDTYYSYVGEILTIRDEFLYYKKALSMNDDKYYHNNWVIINKSNEFELKDEYEFTILFKDEGIYKIHLQVIGGINSDYISKKIQVVSKQKYDEL